MLKKIIIILFLIVITFAQSPAKKWVIIQDLEDRIVYLDTSTIKAYENQLSLWSLTTFRQPQHVTPFQDQVYQIKSNFLFTDAANTYNVIGTLYYDKTTKIIGESSTPRIASGEETFELPVQPGSSIEALFDAAKNYLNTGNVEVPESEYLANTDFSQERPQRRSNTETPSTDTAETQTEPIKLSPEQNIALIDEANVKTLEARDSIQRSDTLRKIKSKQDSVKRSEKPKEEASKPKRTPKPIYDETSDQNIRGNYWSDGNLFVIQLSSWRRENVAKEIVEQKKAEGHNAFVMSVNLPGRELGLE
ncbi:MAG: hypothetical protein U5K00_05855 [Melioribacteraceae bacterium]|nr:hypothetical protein [Melioribacteraceae bacterium]